MGLKLNTDDVIVNLCFYVACFFFQFSHSTLTQLVCVVWSYDENHKFWGWKQKIEVWRMKIWSLKVGNCVYKWQRLHDLKIRTIDTSRLEIEAWRSKWEVYGLQNDCRISVQVRRFQNMKNGRSKHEAYTRTGNASWQAKKLRRIDLVGG